MTLLETAKSSPVTDVLYDFEAMQLFA